MLDFHRRPAIAALLFGFVALFPIPAGAFDLTGAWATDANLCGKVFTKKGSQVVFSELSDLFGTGFIINGNRIRGKAARCTINSTKQDGDNMVLSASCASTIMRSNVQFDLKVVNDNSMSRMFPDMPEMELTYTRCAP